MDGLISRREVLCAGSALGVLSLLGCAEQRSPGTTGVAGLSDPLPAGFPTKAAAVQTVGLEGVLPRSRWAESPLMAAEALRPMNGVSFITVHHDGHGVFAGETESETVARIRALAARQTQRGLSDIGCHFIVDRSGRVWEGRPVVYQGVHVQDHNDHNVGVVCLGDFMKQSPSAAQTQRLDAFLSQLAATYRVRLDAIMTHQEWSATENPGRAMQAYMDRTRAEGGALQRMMMERGLV